MRTRSSNSNTWKSVKPITRMNQTMEQNLKLRTNMNNFATNRIMPFKPTAGLSLNLADNANKYSKMFIQEA